MILEFLKHVSEINERNLTVYTHVHFCCVLTYTHAVMYTDILSTKEKNILYYDCFSNYILKIPSLKFQIPTLKAFSRLKLGFPTLKAWIFKLEILNFKVGNYKIKIGNSNFKVGFSKIKVGISDFKVGILKIKITMWH